MKLVESVLFSKWNRNISNVCGWQGKYEIRYSIQSSYRVLRENLIKPQTENFGGTYGIFEGVRVT